MEYATDSYGLESIACGILCPATNITTDPNPISTRMPLMKITRPKRLKVFGHWILEHSLNVSAAGAFLSYWEVICALSHDENVYN